LEIRDPVVAVPVEAEALPQPADASPEKIMRYLAPAIHQILVSNNT
jgi:hypothetical protein